MSSKKNRNDVVRVRRDPLAILSLSKASELSRAGEVGGRELVSRRGVRPRRELALFRTFAILPLQREKFGAERACFLVPTSSKPSFCICALPPLTLGFWGSVVWFKIQRELAQCPEPG